MRRARFEDRVAAPFLPRHQVGAGGQRDALELAVLARGAGGVIHEKQIAARVPHHMHRPDHVVVAFAGPARLQGGIDRPKTQAIIRNRVRDHVVIRQREMKQMNATAVRDHRAIPQVVRTGTGRGVETMRGVH